MARNNTKKNSVTFVEKYSPCKPLRGGGVKPQNRGL